MLTTKGSNLLAYHEKISSGEIIVGGELQQALNALIEDMSDPAYRFNLAEPQKRILFIETKCKHSISPFAGKPFLLELWQKALMEAIYGFYIEIDGVWLRRFTEVLLLVGRKNGKTTFVSADGLAEFFCGNVGTNILCASNDYEQAGLIFDEINNMREESLSLEKVTRKNIKGIFFGNPKQKKKTGKFSKQNKAKIKKLSVKTGAKEGKNVDKALIDEVHEMKDNSLVMPIRQSMSTKDEYLITEITTEGFTDEGYLDKRLVDARRALKGEIHRPRWLIWLYTQDSEMEIWQDKKTWAKSNPNLGVSKKWRFLEDLIEEAKVNSETRAYMLAKDFNVKQSNAVAWIQQSELINTATFDISEFKGAFYISGNDFAETTDLCATKILLKKPNDRTVYFFSKYWIPESKMENSPDDVDYRKWHREGFINIVPGNTVDTAAVADWHYELMKEYDLKPYKVGYDNRFAKDFIKRFEDIFGDKSITANIPQEAKCINNPMRSLEADLKDKLVNYNNNPVDFWCFKNTGIKLDTFGRMMPVKMHSTKRIDGTAAAIIAYAALQWNQSEFMHIVNGR